jgi:rubrerythrin
MSGLSIIILIFSVIGIALASMGRNEFGVRRKARSNAPPRRAIKVFVCPMCNATVKETEKTCPKCGAEFE